MQVIQKHFKDLYYVQVNGENSLPQEVVVYTESKEDKDLVMVRYFSTSIR